MTAIQKVERRTLNQSLQSVCLLLLFYGIQYVLDERNPELYLKSHVSDKHVLQTWRHKMQNIQLLSIMYKAHMGYTETFIALQPSFAEWLPDYRTPCAGTCCLHLAAASAAQYHMHSKASSYQHLMGSLRSRLTCVALGCYWTTSICWLQGYPWAGVACSGQVSRGCLLAAQMHHSATGQVCLACESTAQPRQLEHSALNANEDLVWSVELLSDVGCTAHAQHMLLHAVTELLWRCGPCGDSVQQPDRNCCLDQQGPLEGSLENDAWQASRKEHVMQSNSSCVVLQPVLLMATASLKLMWL